MFRLRLTLPPSTTKLWTLPPDGPVALPADATVDVRDAVAGPLLSQGYGQRLSPEIPLPPDSTTRQVRITVAADELVLLPFSGRVVAGGTTTATTDLEVAALTAAGLAEPA